MDDKSIVLYKKAQSDDGISWNYKKKFVIHVSENPSSPETACGLKILDSSYGWRKLNGSVSPTCPQCKERLNSFKQKVSSIVSTL
ncbi:hypothetical protein CMI47_04150 [Candidatus Pacearchaeota archaeon]|jgi:hypothetical protein|nr:hypothetical protein [Candidatus Pacearchaeota archaeon]|tara:strand:- start:560 stop:814 length:255 start_codon:yes stop_codon:yes gene_type:complete